MMPSATAFAHAEAGQTHGRRPGLALVLKAGHFHRRKQEIGSERASAGVEGGGLYAALRAQRSECGQGGQQAGLHRNRQALVLAECQEPTT